MAYTGVMAEDARPNTEIVTEIDPLLARSVIVTGTHYSTTTLVGALLHTAPEFHLLHEPLNPEPTLSYDSLKPPRWYEYYDDDRFGALQAGLARMLRRGPVIPELLKRAIQIRSGKQLGQVGRYAQRKLPVLLSPRPAILKDPFLAFSARTLQQRAGTKVVVCLRHPGGFAESMVRKAGYFDFTHFTGQPWLMDMLAGDAELVERFARTPGTPHEQAALLWRVVYGFAVRHLLPDPRTTLVRQEEFLSSREATAQRLLAFVGGTKTERLQRFLSENFRSHAPDRSGNSYIRRDPHIATMQWRSKMTPAEVATVREMTEPLAHDLGYDTESWPR